MIWLPKISEAKRRIKKIKGEVGLYWLDRLVEQYQRSYSQKVLVGGQVLAILDDSYDKIIVPGLNIVTDVGDTFYAYRGANEQPANDHFTSGAALTFDGIMELYNGASASPAKGNDRSNLTDLVTGSAKVIDATYPTRNDGDSDNSGAGADVITYRVSYTTGEANDTGIADVIITNPSPGASENLLMHAEFASSFDKTSSDTLKVFVNHTMNGV